MRSSLQAYEHRTFFTRLHQFVLMSDAFIVVPGGIGTVLEAMMIWQLLQVRHIEGTPLILTGKMYQDLVGLVPELHASAGASSREQGGHRPSAVRRRQRGDPADHPRAPRRLADGSERSRMKSGGEDTTMTSGTGKYERLLERCRGIAPVPTAVAYPCDESSLSGAIDAARLGLIVPILVGPAATITEVAKSKGIDLGGVQIVEAATTRASAAKAVEMVRLGQAELVMKGSLHSDEVLGAVIAKETGLRTGRRLSHAFLMDVPTYHKVLIVTDAAINIAPTLEDKVDICQNAIDLAKTFGVDRPKVAILAAVETVNSKMPATLDAAALCKMADRGQIKGGILDGPLAFDNAISRDAAKTKGIASEVAGDPDILLAPDLEAGNMMAKMLSFLANSDSAGLVLGAKVPVILTSRADSVRARIASCAVAVMAAHARRQPPR